MSLFVIATPLGNLKDITKRAVETLEIVHLILAEDTRRGRQLLSFLRITKRIDSFHEHSSERKIEAILALLQEGKDIALITDAGTPSISDPGGKLIAAVYEKLTGVKVIPIPGPSAVTAALSICGFPVHQFTFFGYPPKKSKKRKIFFESIASSPHTALFFSTPYSIFKDLEELKNLCVPSRKLLVCREMTKMFETYYQGT